MNNKISNKHRAKYVGALILAAYSMLAYDITGNITLGVFTDIISGLAVIIIPVLMLPVFDVGSNKAMYLGYLVSRLIEGLLMIMGALFILSPSLERYRAVIYSDIHVYFFISGALLFYLLFYRTKIIPEFISIWGMIAALFLLASTIIQLFGANSILLDILLLPMILNELFLACWLIIKGFTLNSTDG